MTGFGGAVEPPPPVEADGVAAGRNPAPLPPPPPLKWDEATTSPVLLCGPRGCGFGVPAVSAERTDAATDLLDPNGRKAALLATWTTLPATLLGISCGPVRLAFVGAGAGAGVEEVVPARGVPPTPPPPPVDAPARPSELPAALNPPPPGAVPAIVESLGERQALAVHQSRARSWFSCARVGG